MGESPFALPPYLPQAAGLQRELEKKYNQLQNSPLWPLWQKIAALGVANQGFCLKDGAIQAPTLLPGAEAIAWELCPWRKGPFAFGDFTIDAEWRSDFKWNRLSRQLPSLVGKTIADVGCNNGYYLYRIREAGAANILGFDPTLRYFLQYALVRAHTGSVADYLPLGWQALWHLPGAFDAIFLMGVNYHEPEPLELLHACHAALRSGGFLVVESVVLPGESDWEIFPAGKYHGIGGVFAIPSLRTLKRQLELVGFVGVEGLHEIELTPEEQRRTPFSPQPSLAEHLAKSKGNYPPLFRGALIARAGS
ncbi:MAG: tRNA 5-methoxyuridine(34)/uridine 5-oxyacetic acid(34) synthase CmoB [Leptospiraceae bacterium]|nr:tRNA 5-methoxyuridine(34)/uridine 5-oxyacetic acid(34) synthase CmoB [Leptospiraceae bacterium]